jgi:HlyD family secretion protein
MNARSRSMRCSARRLLVSGLVAVVWSLQGWCTGLAQDPTSSAKSAGSPDKPTLSVRLRAQQLVMQKARTVYEIARLNRELAEIAVAEYVEVKYPQDLAAIEGEIKLLESELRKAEDRLEWSTRMRKKGYISESAQVSEQLNLEKAKFALEQAQSKKKVLVEYTRPKTIQALQVALDKARNDELDKKAAWKHEEAKEADLEREADRK